MRRSIPSILILVTLAAPASARHPDAAPARFAGFSRLLDLASEPWSLKDWPGRDRATCRPLRSEWSPASYTELWCTECTLDEGTSRGLFRFYPDLGKDACTLQEVELDL